MGEPDIGTRELRSMSSVGAVVLRIEDLVRALIKDDRVDNFYTAKAVCEAGDALEKAVVTCIENCGSQSGSTSSGGSACSAGSDCTTDTPKSQTSGTRGSDASTAVGSSGSSGGTDPCDTPEERDRDDGPCPNSYQVSLDPKTRTFSVSLDQYQTLLQEHRELSVAHKTATERAEAAERRISAITSVWCEVPLQSNENRLWQVRMDDAVFRGVASSDALAVENRRLKHVVNETVEALGVAPKGAPFLSGWALTIRTERDLLRDRARSAAARLIAEIGSSGRPEDVDDVAERTVQELRRLRAEVELLSQRPVPAERRER